MRPPPRSSRLCLPSRALRFAPFGSRTPRLLRDLLPADADPPQHLWTEGSQQRATSSVVDIPILRAATTPFPTPHVVGGANGRFWRCRTLPADFGLA